VAILLFLLLPSAAGAQGSTGCTNPHDAGERSPTLPEVRRRVDVMLIHLNQALFALSGNSVGVARSQFKQFFDVWDDVDDAVEALYPAECAQIDHELNRVEDALLHPLPGSEDLATARSGLENLRAIFLEIAPDLDARLSGPAPESDGAE
jgi:hypothetical protein